MWLAGLCSLALGGSQLVLASDRPVVAYVNLTPKPLRGGAHTVEIDYDDGDAGTKRVALRNVTQQLVWTGQVEVPEGHRVTVSYLNKRVVVSEPTEIRKVRPKLSQRGLYNVDGEWVRDRPNQSPRVVGAPADDEPPAAPKEDVFLGAVEEAGTTEGAGGQREATQAVSRPGVGLGDGVLRLANRNTSWATLVVDGEDVLFRGERTQELTLPSGPHPLEVRDFRQELVWRGTVWVWPDETVELQFSQATEPATPERPDAWEGKPLPEPVTP